MRYAGWMAGLPLVWLAAACGGRPGADGAEAAHVEPTTPPVVEMVGNDFAFVAPDTLPSGAVTIRFRNDGGELHHVALYRLEAGRTLSDLMQAMQTGHTAPPWATEIGGPNAAMPMGGIAEATVMLEPGPIAILCVIPSPDGVLHVAKGMVKEAVVTKSARSAAPPTSHLTMTLTDYDFTFSAEPTAGTHLLRVEVQASQPHEVVIVRLGPGQSAMDVAHWAEKPEGPPPGIPVGGTTGIAPGRFNVIPLVLEPGEYGLLCFWPDHEDGKPHIVHGMIKQFKVS